jgi:hypothetical protein
LLKNYRNLGNGHSLRKGILHSQAEWILTSNIDLSVNIDHYKTWFLNRNSQINYFIYFRSRNHPNAKVKKTFLRYLLSQIFRILFIFYLKLNFTTLNADINYIKTQ